MIAKKFAYNTTFNNFLLSKKGELYKVFKIQKAFTLHCNYRMSCIPKLQSTIFTK